MSWQDLYNTFPGRVGLQQRVLPDYRSAFFDQLAAACEGGLSVIAGEAHAEESIATNARLEKASYFSACNRHFLRINSPWYMLWQQGLQRWLEEWNPDVLILEANPRYLSNWRAMGWMHARGRPVIGWGLGAPALRVSSFPKSLISGIQSRWRKAFLFSCEALIAYSRRGSEEYRSLGYPPEKIFIATNAVAPRPINPAPERASRFEGRPTVLFVGRLQARKRIDNLLQACASLPEPVQPNLCIVGDGPARPEIERLAATIYPRAEFPGPRRGADLLSYFRKADLFILPGTGGLAIQEAMTFGLPVIVAQGDGTQDDLVRPGNGWQIPSDNVSALEEALNAALSSVSRLRQMGNESYRIVREEVNLEMMVEVFLRALNTVKGLKPGVQ